MCDELRSMLELLKIRFETTPSHHITGDELLPIIDAILEIEKEEQYPIAINGGGFTPPIEVSDPGDTTWELRK